SRRDVEGAGAAGAVVVVVAGERPGNVVVAGIPCTGPQGQQSAEVLAEGAGGRATQPVDHAVIGAAVASDGNGGGRLAHRERGLRGGGVAVAVVHQDAEIGRAHV